MMCNSAVMCSMFFALKGMTEAPVPSMATEGALWFMDLTTNDPLFLLPILTSVSTLINLKLGADGIDMNRQPKFMKNLMFSLPFLALPVMCYFPSVSEIIWSDLFSSDMLFYIYWQALNVYWFTSNLSAIVQSRAFRNQEFCKRLEIPEAIHWAPEDLPMYQKLYGSFGQPKKSPLTSADVEQHKNSQEEHLEKLKESFRQQLSNKK